MHYNLEHTRSLKDNVVLALLTAFTAGAVNVLSFMLFFAFSGNITGYYAIMAAEIMRGNLYQVAVVAAWIFLFFLGGFSSKLILIHLTTRQPHLAYTLPVFLQVLCLMAVGFYGEYFYKETLDETEMLISLLVYAMGLQNGFTAGISGFAVKTTHLTGATTDMGVLFALFTHKQWRNQAALKAKAWLLLFTAVGYLAGALLSGLAQGQMGFRLFYLICFVPVLVLVYEYRRTPQPKYRPLEKAKKPRPEYERLQQ